MEVVYKYPLELVEKQELRLPDNHEILDIQLQNGVPCLWVLLNSDDMEPSAEHRFYITMVGTGHPFNSKQLSFIKTLQLSNQLVFHFFWNWTSI